MLGGPGVSMATWVGGPTVPGVGWGEGLAGGGGRPSPAEQPGCRSPPGVFRSLTPCACLSPEPVQACVLNGTIIGVS